MSERHGYIRISRKLYAECPFWNEPRIYSRHEAWEDLIQMAAWKPHRRVVGGEVVELDRGELLASVRFLAERWQWSVGKVFRWLKLVQKMGRIRNGKRTAGGDTYLLVNYEAYQSQWNGGGNSNGNDHGTATEQQRNKEKEGKKGKEGKNYPPYPPSLDTPEFAKSWADYEEHRRQKRDKFTSVARQRALSKLEKWGAERAIAALEWSMENGWTGIHEQKSGGGAGKGPTREPVGTDDARRAQIAKLD